MTALSQELRERPIGRMRVAERVNTRTVAFSGQLRRVPTAAWLVLLIAGGVVTAILVSVLVTPTKATISTHLVAFPGGDDPRQFVVRYQIEKPSHADVTCTVQAIGIEHDIVGSVPDTTPARDDTTRTSTRDVTVPTTKQAVSAEITQCQVVARR